MGSIYVFDTFTWLILTGIVFVVSYWLFNSKIKIKKHPERDRSERAEIIYTVLGVFYLITVVGLVYYIRNVNQRAVDCCKNFPDLCGVFWLGNSSYGSLVSVSNLFRAENSSWTKSVCGFGYCQDYLIDCEGNNLVGMTPITKPRYVGEDWVDERPKEIIDWWC